MRITAGAASFIGREKMATNRQKQVDEVMEYLYKAYGTGSGHLLGIPPEKKESVRAIVIAIMRRYDLFDTCEDMLREGYQEEQDEYGPELHGDS